jgi:hypothetical protein
MSTLVTPLSLNGSWASGARERLVNPDGSVVYATRGFYFTESHWSVRFTGYANEAGPRLFTVYIAGGYTLGPPAPAVSEARHGEFRREHITFTPHADGFVRVLEGAAPGHPWALEQPEDVSDTGCLTVSSVERYPVEHDLVALRDDRLFFGQRPAAGDMDTPERRPRELTAAPVLRRREAVRPEAQPRGAHLSPLGTLTIQLDSPLLLGPTPAGMRTIVGWREIELAGDRIAATRVGVAADWVTFGPDGTATLDMRFTLKTHDDAIVHVAGNGRADVRKGPGTGDSFCAFHFETSDPRYQWLNRVQAVSKGGLMGGDLFRAQLYQVA